MRNSFLIECDGISNLHNPITVNEDQNALRVYCKQCLNQYIIRKDPNTGAPHKAQYAKIFRRDTLQGNTNLFYKIYPQWLRT